MITSQCARDAFGLVIRAATAASSSPVILSIDPVDQPADQQHPEAQQDTVDPALTCRSKNCAASRPDTPSARITGSLRSSPTPRAYQRTGIAFPTGAALMEFAHRRGLARKTFASSPVVAEATQSNVREKLNRQNPNRVHCRRQDHGGESFQPVMSRSPERSRH
jgi:hypothetical protein